MNVHNKEILKLHLTFIKYKSLLEWIGRVKYFLFYHDTSDYHDL